MQSQSLPSVLLALGLAVQAPLAFAAPPGAPDMTISKAHSGNFTTGDVGDTYSLFVTNSGSKPSSGTVTVVDTLPSGLTATAIGGSGWGCTLATLTCTRSDVLASEVLRSQIPRRELLRSQILRRGFLRIHFLRRPSFHRA